MTNDGDDLSVNRREFASVIGVSKARIVQLIALGLRETVEGIPLRRGVAWYQARISITAANMWAWAGVEQRMRAVIARRQDCNPEETVIRPPSKGEMMK